MMKKLGVFIFFCVWFSISGTAQVALSPHQVNMGVIDEFSDRIVEFTLKNTSNQIAYIFRGDDNTGEFSIRFSTKKIYPDSTAIVRLLYNPHQKGDFNYKLPLYVSVLNQPLYLKISGTSTVVRPDDIPCPDFNQAPSSNITLAVKFLDAKTRQALPQVTGTMLFNGHDKKFKADANGIIRIRTETGQHYLEGHAPGYTSVDTTLFASRVFRTAILLLDPLNHPAPKPVLRDTDMLVTAAGRQPEEIPENQPAPDAPKAHPQDPYPQFPISVYKPNNIVILVDVSGSMRYKGKLDLLKLSMLELLNMLRPVDQLSIVAYSTDAAIIMPPDKIDDKEKWEDAIKSLQASGKTNGEKGIKLACELALQGFIPDGNNEVFLATDGAFSEESASVSHTAHKYTKKGLKISVVGIKNANWTVPELTSLAEEGNGSYIHLEEIDPAKTALRKEVEKQSLR